MNQKEKVELLQGALRELCEDVGVALRRARDVLHDVKFGPGPAMPVVVDLGKNLERKLARMSKKLGKRSQRNSTGRYKSTQR